jgi:fructokinase
MKVICVGEMLIDFVCTDTNAGLVKGYNFVKKPGGAPANVTACIGKLGGDAFFVGAVGRDPFGDYLLKELRHYNVNLDYAFQLPRSTTLAFVSLADDGEREFAFNRGADEQLVLSKNEIDTLLDDSILHLGSATALLGGDLSASYLAIAKAAKQNGNIISFDPNFRIDLWKGREEAFKEVCETYFQLADVVKVSDEEMLLLTDQTDTQKGCEYFHARGVKVVLVTLGSKGCLVSQAGAQYVVPAYEVDAVDTTGAGDSFIGGVLFQMAANAPQDDFYASQFRQFVEFAEKVSGQVCSKIGAMTALPTLMEIDSMKFIVKKN